MIEMSGGTVSVKGFDELAGLDWEDTLRVQSLSETILRGVSDDRAMLRELLGKVPHNPALLEKCEHYDILEKLVLAEDPASGARLRLHVFLPGYIDRPHNHRWTYSSLILSGRYLHQIYGEDDGLTERVDVDELVPLLVRNETRGSTYTLHHSMIHSLVAEPYTVSLVLRGPAVKKRFLVMDKATKQSWWQYGAADERAMPKADRPAVAEKRTMSAGDVVATIDRLSNLGVI
jgi:hypothetical protein